MFVTELPKDDETHTCMPRKNDITALGKRDNSDKHLKVSHVMPHNQKRKKYILFPHVEI